jgi:Tol biopolymer transport system component
MAPVWPRSSWLIGVVRGRLVRWLGLAFQLAAGLALGLATALTALAVALPTSAQAAFPGRNGRIAYEDERTLGPPCCLGPFDTASQILSVAPNGSRPRTLLGFDRFLLGPAYSPNGRKLAGSRGGPCGNAANSLYLVRADGRGRLRGLTLPPCHGMGDNNPGWAPDGRRLVFVRYGLCPPFAPEPCGQIRVYHARKSRRIASVDATHPVWSLRGRIAFSAGDVIYTMRPDGSHRRRVAAGEHPDWSPHGNWIVYELPTPPEKATPYGGGGGIAMIRPRDGRRHILTTSSAGAPAFSPNGNYIVFQRYDAATGRQGVVVMRLRDRRTRTVVAALPTRSTSSGGSESHVLLGPTWQPLPRRRHR